MKNIIYFYFLISFTLTQLINCSTFQREFTGSFTPENKQAFKKTLLWVEKNRENTAGKNFYVLLQDKNEDKYEIKVTGNGSCSLKNDNYPTAAANFLLNISLFPKNAHFTFKLINPGAYNNYEKIPPEDIDKLNLITEACWTPIKDNLLLSINKTDKVVYQKLLDELSVGFEGADKQKNPGIIIHFQKGKKGEPKSMAVAAIFFGFVRASFTKAFEEIEDKNSDFLQFKKLYSEFDSGEALNSENWTGHIENAIKLYPKIKSNLINLIGRK